MSLFSKFVIAGILFFLGADYEMTSNEVNEVPGLVPGTTVVEETAHFTNGKNELFAFYWQPSAPRDGGPMEAKESWKMEVLGQQATVSETSMFHGREQRVLVAHIPLKDPEAVLMIYSPDMGRMEFENVLRTLRRQD
jgi:hypothetical protein